MSADTNRAVVVERPFPHAWWTVFHDPELTRLIELNREEINKNRESIEKNKENIAKNRETIELNQSIIEKLK